MHCFIKSLSDSVQFVLQFHLLPLEGEFQNQHSVSSKEEDIPTCNWLK